MKICLICVEIFEWGKYGGFGRATRMLGRELVRRGIEVCVVTPRRRGQRPVEQLDGMTVYGFPMYFPWTMSRLFTLCDADIYHSQQPSFGTYLALEAMPRKRHIATFRDPKDREDWRIEFERPSAGKLQVALNWIYEERLGVRSAIRRLDGLYCAACCLNHKLRQKYGFSSDLDTLPTPVALRSDAVKSPTPTVCFASRWDRRKRPQIFFDLAKQFPQVEFIAAGRSRDKAWERYLRETYSGVPNLKLVGFVDQFRSSSLSDILASSWVLVNTAAREGLPTAFLEALAHKCAILSHVNPDDVASRFGYHAKDDDFTRGLSALLERNAWREKGEVGYEYVHDNFELGSVIDKHMAVYQALLERSPGASNTGRGDRAPSPRQLV